MSAHVFSFELPETRLGIGDFVRSILQRVAVHRAAQRRRRTVQAELRQYTARELTELGIGEADIEFVADDAANR